MGSAKSELYYIILCFSFRCYILTKLFTQNVNFFIVSRVVFSASGGMRTGRSMLILPYLLFAPPRFRALIGCVDWQHIHMRLQFGQLPVTDLTTFSHTNLNKSCRSMKWKSRENEPDLFTRAKPRSRQVTSLYLFSRSFSIHGYFKKGTHPFSLYRLV